MSVDICDWYIPVNCASESWFQLSMFLSNCHYTLLNYMWASQNTDLLHYPLLYYLILLMQSVKCTQLFKYYLFISFICLSCSCICFCLSHLQVRMHHHIKKTWLEHCSYKFDYWCYRFHAHHHLFKSSFCSEFRWLSNSFVYKVYYFLIFHYYIITLILPRL